MCVFSGEKTAFRSLLKKKTKKSQSACLTCDSKNKHIIVHHPEDERAVLRALKITIRFDNESLLSAFVPFEDDDDDDE